MAGIPLPSIVPARNRRRVSAARLHLAGFQQRSANLFTWPRQGDHGRKVPAVSRGAKFRAARPRSAARRPTCPQSGRWNRQRATGTAGRFGTTHAGPRVERSGPGTRWLTVQSATAVSAGDSHTSSRYKSPEKTSGRRHRTRHDNSSATAKTTPQPREGRLSVSLPGTGTVTAGGRGRAGRAGPAGGP